VQWFDAVRWLFGNPIEVSAMCANVFPQGRDGEEFSAALVRMESGVVVQLCADPFRGYRGTRIEIVGTDGALQWAAADNRIAIQRLGGRERREEDVFVDEEELVGAELRHFLACVLTGRTPITDGAEGRAALTLALVVRRAVRLRRTIAVGDGSRRAGGRRGLPTLLRLVHAG
jgi:predicted dehydrogenase